MTLLEMVLLIIISVQVLNGLANILTAINMRKHAKLQAEVRKLEHERLMEHLDLINLKFSEIMDTTIDANEKLDYLLTYFDDLRDNSEPKPTKSRKRGKYGPRKRKEIEHKKTPPE